MNHQLLGRVPLRIQLLRWARHISLSVYRRFFQVFWRRICACSCGARYRRLLVEVSEPRAAAMSSVLHTDISDLPGCTDAEASSDEMVWLKVSLLGDCHVGKTSFMVKYVGEEEEKKGMGMSGLNLMDKILMVRDARIALTIWDVGGDRGCVDHVPLACKDAVAILFMFDLTSRSTLNNVKDWYIRARKWNKTAIPILIGLKFDDFCQLPLDMQWTVITEEWYMSLAVREFHGLRRLYMGLAVRHRPHKLHMGLTVREFHGLRRLYTSLVKRKKEKN